MKPRYKVGQLVRLHEFGHPIQCKILKIEPFKNTYYYHLEKVGVEGYNTCQEFEHSLSSDKVGNLLYG